MIGRRRAPPAGPGRGRSPADREGPRPGRTKRAWTTGVPVRARTGVRLGAIPSGRAPAGPRPLPVRPGERSRRRLLHRRRAGRRPVLGGARRPAGPRLLSASRGRRRSLDAAAGRHQLLAWPDEVGVGPDDLTVGLPPPRPLLGDGAVISRGRWKYPACDRPQRVPGVDRDQHVLRPSLQGCTRRSRAVEHGQGGAARPVEVRHLARQCQHRGRYGRKGAASGRRDNRDGKCGSQHRRPRYHHEAGPQAEVEHATQQARGENAGGCCCQPARRSWEACRSV